MKFNISYILISLSLLFFTNCKKSWLNVQPEDKITSVSFWQDEADVKLALDGLYSVLRDENMYGYGPRLDATNSNGYQWGATDLTAIGDGSVTPSIGGFISGHWTFCYKLIFRCNYFLANIDKVKLDASAHTTYVAEAHFLRGVAYSLLAQAYGGVPIIDSAISVDEARNIGRASLEDTWKKAISEYDMAIKDLSVVAPEVGRATKGAALGMEMRAYLYQNNYPKVLELVSQIDALDTYALFPSYHGLFQVENENNSGVLFDIQYIAGNHELGNRFDRGIQPQNLKNGVNGASRIAATQDFVDAYEMINGGNVDPAHPYEGRDPRLDFTLLRPGAYFQDQLYPTEVQSHSGQRDPYLIRKYTIENMAISGNYNESPLNFIVLRYADVLLSKAEALIETNQNINEAIALINKIRTERTDVKITALPMNLSQAAARVALRHERRIEFAFEGIYWEDVKRWNIGPDIYPIDVRDANGGLIETKFPRGYQAKDNLLPIPESERSLNPNLTQNEGW